MQRAALALLLLPTIASAEWASTGFSAFNSQGTLYCYRCMRPPEEVMLLMIS